ncbi:MAG TPA: heparinase II/III family protein [Gemmatimonadales bacterium]
MSSAWLPASVLAERRRAATGPLAPLAASLAADLEPVLARDLWLPPEKARLSRSGGRCSADGAYLRFDPGSPRRHACPTCGRVYDEEAHYRWWIMGYHLWLAERAVHAALLHALLGDDRHRAFAEGVLGAYCDAYPRYPNRDNVLGPTRPFFSTYLESIWLLQLCVALDLLEGVGAGGGVAAGARERVIAPSEALVASFPEGDSNRQVWNDAALLAARLVLGRAGETEELVWGRHGLAGHLTHALLADGSWYEGENYHLFAHRGLWYGVALAGAAGQGPLPPELVARFDEGFVVPFQTALPDFTFPARRDSQYGVSLRQWRFAELAELGLARRPGDRRLHDAIVRLYDPTVPQGDSGRWRSTAEAERNEPPVRLDRAGLGWRSLLCALPELPPLEPRPPASVLLEGQGLAVFRREAGRTYAALDYGESGGGHGHPDRLNIIHSVGGERVLDDPGTGSYVDPSLHWYRSTLAHHAPMVDGRDQRRVNGGLLAYDERGGAGWVEASVAGVAPGVALRRALVVMPGYLVDELAWTAGSERRVALPVHGDLVLATSDEWVDDALDADGAAYLSRVERLARPLSGVVALRRADDGSPRAWYVGDAPLEWWRAIAPGAPGRASQRMHLALLSGQVGRLRAVWSRNGALAGVELDGDVLVVRTADGVVHRHSRRDDGSWAIELGVGGARSSIVLGGRTAAAARPSSPEPLAGPEPAMPLPARFVLAEPDYRRSEDGWRDAGSPTATVLVDAPCGMLSVRVVVEKPELAPVPAGAGNDMDNERPEINGDSVQLHVGLAPPGGDEAAVPLAGWIVVPGADAAARVVPLDARAAGIPLDVSCSVRAGGYEVVARLPLASLDATGVGLGRSIVLGLLVNDGAPGRERRRGQLVLGGARREFVYLRGDRHDARRCLRFQLP